MNVLKLTAVLMLAATLFSCKKDDLTPSDTYSKVRIDKLEVLNFPITQSDGSNWDGAAQGTFPDMYFKVARANTTTIVYQITTGSRVENINLLSLPANWTGMGGISLFDNDINQPIDIAFFDYDSSSGDDNMGGVSVDFSNYTFGSDKFPGTITLNNGLFSIKLYITWLV